MEEVLPGLYRFEDSCNVYLLVDGDAAMAIDYGTGAWRAEAEAAGLPAPSELFLTHHHTDQCSGLEAGIPEGMTVHAPAGERSFLEPATVAERHAGGFSGGVPESHALLEHGIDGVLYDMQGFSDLYWKCRRVRFMSTPGHSAAALSVIVDVGDRQVVFCGDAAHADATVHQPYHLEWDHWTGSGALAAWEGIERLEKVRIDLLCPSHGPVVRVAPRAMLRALAEKLLAFYHSKGSICAGEADRYVQPTFTGSGARQLLPHLYQFGCNGYLVVSDRGEGLVVDPTLGDMDALDALLAEIGGLRVTASTASHYHLDHVDGAPLLRERHGALLWLHPWVAAPLPHPGAIKAPWLPAVPIVADSLLPEEGEWSWSGYTFRVAPFPGQTWWHCCLQAEIDGRRVFFGGDSFQPTSRWNGTGGYCAFNGSRFEEGFVRSARLMMEWQPEIIATGHGTFYRYSRSHMEQIIAWARRTREAVTALCPHGDLEQDYYLHRCT